MQEQNFKFIIETEDGDQHILGDVTTSLPLDAVTSVLTMHVNAIGMTLAIFQMSYTPEVH